MIMTHTHVWMDRRMDGGNCITSRANAVSNNVQYIATSIKAAKG